MPGSGIIYKLVRPIADALVDAVFDRLFEPKRLKTEAEDAGDSLVPPAVAAHIADWLFRPNQGDPQPDYTPQDSRVVPRTSGDATTRRESAGDNGHPAGVGHRQSGMDTADVDGGQ